MAFFQRGFRAGIAALLVAAALVLGTGQRPLGAALDTDRLARVLDGILASSNLGYPSRIVGISEMGRGSLAVSFWAQRAPDRDGIAAGVLADAWRIFTATFPAAGFPVDVAVHALFPVEEPDGSVSVRVVGHFRLTAATYRRLRETGAGPADLMEGADAAMIFLEGMTGD